MLILMDSRPDIIKEYGFDFFKDIDALWSLDLPSDEIPVADLAWHLDIPWWEMEGTDDWNLTPAPPCVTLRLNQPTPLALKPLISHIRFTLPFGVAVGPSWMGFIASPKPPVAARSSSRSSEFRRICSRI